MPDYRQFINRTAIAGDNGDIVSNYHWELIIDRWPEAIYYPGDKVFKTRLTNVTPPLTTLDHQIHDINIMGFHIKQPGDIDYSGSIQGDFQDYVDQSVQAIFLDWAMKCQDPESRLGLRKRLLIMDCTLFQFDRANNPIKQWQCFAGMYKQHSSGEAFAGENTPGGKIGFSVDFEHVVPKLLNV